MGRPEVVGLLNTPLSLVRVPLQLSLKAWEVGLSTAAEAARIGSELLDPDRGAPEADFARRTADANGFPEEAAVVVEEPRVVVEKPEPPLVPDAPPPVPDALIPDHVDADAVLVAEAAEEGAEDGAGAELHVESPWEGYDHMTAGEIRDRLVAASPAEAAAVELYEGTRRKRRTVLDAAERALRG
jgi:hypothetical protein